MSNTDTSISPATDSEGATPALILASGSRQRQAILETLHLPFQAISAEYDEASLTDPDPVERARRLALAKVDTVAAQHPDAVVLGGDTFLQLDGETLEKPGDLETAAAMLRALSGKTAIVITGYAYLDQRRDIRESGAVTASMELRTLSEDEIGRYVEYEPVLEWSGALCPAYVSGMALLASVEGSFTGVTHGLPLEEIVPLLRQSGYSI